MYKQCWLSEVARQRNYWLEKLELYVSTLCFVAVGVPQLWLILVVHGLTFQTVFWVKVVKITLFSKELITPVHFKEFGKGVSAASDSALTGVSFTSWTVAATRFGMKYCSIFHRLN